MTRSSAEEAIEAAMAAANVMLRVAARSVVEVEDRVTTPQLRVLMLIETEGPQSLTGVAAELEVHPSNATRTCDKLVRAGYITARRTRTTAGTSGSTSPLLGVS